MEEAKIPQVGGFGKITPREMDAIIKEVTERYPEILAETGHYIIDHLRLRGVESPAVTALAAGPLKVISGGVISVADTEGYITIDTENEDAADDLTDIVGGVTGQLLMIRQKEDTREVTVKHNAGGAEEIYLGGGADYILNYRWKPMLLIKSATGGGWWEVARAAP